MRNRIRLDTTQDAIKFASITQKFGDDADITITDGRTFRVNAKSILGVLYSLEFSELWCESNIDIYTKIEEFVI